MIIVRAKYNEENYGASVGSAGLGDHIPDTDNLAKVANFKCGIRAFRIGDRMKETPAYYSFCAFLHPPRPDYHWPHVSLNAAAETSVPRTRVSYQH